MRGASGGGRGGNPGEKGKETKCRCAPLQNKKRNFPPKKRPPLLNMQWKGYTETGKGKCETPQHLSCNGDQGMEKEDTVCASNHSLKAPHGLKLKLT
jgi:hypothetical protein